MRFIIVLSVLLLLAASASADTVTTDFEGGTNLGNWTYQNWAEGVQPAGGNPDGWFASGENWTFAPVLQCEPGAPIFTGNYNTMGVTRISGDFLSIYCQNSWANTYNFTVLFRNDGGTPNDIEDDFYVYPDPFANLIPQIGLGWTHYGFDIPSNFVGGPGELPAGWVGGSYLTGLDVFPADKTFQDVMTSVTTVEFWWIHPAFWATVEPWEVGGDNITIEFGSGPVAIDEATWGGVKALYR